MLSGITDSKVYLALHFGVQCTCQGGVMGKAIIFIETPMFTRQIKQIATDDELKELQKNSSELPIKVISFSRLVDCVKSEWLRVHREKVAVSE